MISPVIYIMGVSGSGKTTIGRALSAVTGIPFFDGDDFHSDSNKQKMKAGHPLNDSDRETWLLSLNNLARAEAGKKGAIIACSALKEMYRAVLAKDIPGEVKWVYLNGNYDLVSERIKARKDHFMPESLLPSQFQTLEAPENAVVAAIDKEPSVIVADIVKQLGL